MSTEYLKYCWSLGGVTSSKFFTKLDEDGNIHSDDGPAILDDTKIEYYKHGKKHRLEGPAVYTARGGEIWYINGKEVTYQLSQWAKENNIDLYNMSEYDLNLLKLCWS